TAAGYVSPARPRRQPCCGAACHGRGDGRPRRWTAAVATRIDLQEEYRAWLDNFPANLEGSRLAQKLQTSPRSTSTNCRRSIHRADTAATDRKGASHQIPRSKLQNLTDTILRAHFADVSRAISDPASWDDRGGGFGNNSTRLPAAPAFI